MKTINQKIQRAFSRSAQNYDLLSEFHRCIANKILGQIDDKINRKVLLDVGCGTGYLTARLQEIFPQSKTIGLDFAQGMLRKARTQNPDIAWVLGDCHHLPFSDESFDAVVSNLAYQWAGNLGQAFGEAHRVLLSGGIMEVSLFGYQTCRELFQSLEESSHGTIQPNRLPDRDKIEQALVAGGFKDFQIDIQESPLIFKDMQELLFWLKSIGANNLGLQGFLGPEAYLRATDIYREKFSCEGGVTATFEVIYVHAEK